MNTVFRSGKLLGALGKGIFHLLKQILKYIPVTIPLQGKWYKIQSPEDLFLIAEIVIFKIYTPYLPRNIKRFVDLGCNSGIFSTFVSQKNSLGLAVDGNCDILAQAKKSFNKNRLKITTEYGVVGADLSKDYIEFKVNKSSLASSLKAFNKQAITPDDFKVVNVPVLKLHRILNDVFREERIDLMKIDIEGAELDLLLSEPQIFKYVDYIIIEVHTWLVNFHEVEEELNNLEFSLIKIIEKDSNATTAVFKYKQL